MAQAAVPSQHPSVVLRSQYVHLRALFLAALIALIALTATVVILAVNDDGSSSTVTATPSAISAPAADGVRYDGGPEEGTRGASIAPATADAAPADGVRYDGGPEEGTRAASIAPVAADGAAADGVRYDGGPEEGAWAIGR